MPCVQHILLLTVTYCFYRSIDKDSIMAAPNTSPDTVAVLVTVEIEPSMEEEFVKIMTNDAIESRKEEGCLTFHLLKVAGKESTYSFYEAYKNVDAQKLHKTLPHYLEWAEFKKKGGVKSQVVISHSGLNIL